MFGKRGTSLLLVFTIITALLSTVTIVLRQTAANVPVPPVHQPNHIEEAMWNSLQIFATENNLKDVVARKDLVLPDTNTILENCSGINLKEETNLLLWEWSMNHQSEQLWVTYRIVDSNSEVLATYDANFKVHAGTAEDLTISKQCVVNFK